MDIEKSYESRHPLAAILEGLERSAIPKTLTEKDHLFGVDRANAAVSIAVDPVALIITECITVTSAMRKDVRLARSSISTILGGGGPYQAGSHSVYTNEKERGEGVHTNGTARSNLRTGKYDSNLTSHWGGKGKKGKVLQDNPLMSAFARLRGDLRGCTG